MIHVRRDFYKTRFFIEFGCVSKTLLQSFGFVSRTQRNLQITCSVQIAPKMSHGQHIPHTFSGCKFLNSFQIFSRTLLNYSNCVLEWLGNRWNTTVIKHDSYETRCFRARLWARNGSNVTAKAGNFDVFIPHLTNLWPSTLDIPPFSEIQEFKKNCRKRTFAT